MFCTRCGNQIDQSQEARFCSSCGANVGSVPTPAVPKEPSAFQQSLTKYLAATRTWIANLNLRKVALFAGSGLVALVLILVGAVFAIDEYKITAKDKVELSTVLSDSELKGLVDESCAPAKALIISPSDRSTYETHLTALERYASSPNSRLVLKFQNANYWTTDTLPDIEEQLLTDVRRTLGGALKKNPRIQADSQDAILASLIPAFRSKVLSDCGIEDEFKDSAEFTASYNSTQADFSSKADSAPWYPAGYFERNDGSDQLAFKWVERGHDCYSCYQWDMNVISKYGCPGGIYAQINIEQGSNVVGWTNDSLPSLSAGQTGQLRFQSYLSGYGSLTANLVELNCHN